MDSRTSDFDSVFIKIHENQIYLQKQIILLQQEEEARQRAQHIEGLKTIYCSAWSSAATYTNLITLAGYAGFFGLLSIVKDHIAPFGLVLSSFFIGISLTIFVLYEVFKMAHNNIHFKKTISLINERGENLVEGINQHANKYSALDSKVWIYSFIPTVAFGLLGVLTILYFFFLSIHEMLLTQLG
ncbi:MAG: hypothetical protein ACRCYW_15250 [Aeromonas sp.]|uniref:hypothetical protein n=1 Tax=Aeromonas sp. TaxID=647 RepID=UPI003F413129